MRNPTEMMNQILTSPSAQKMIDYVSPVYGNSYVGLWIFQAMGTIIDPAVDYATALRKEANPITSVLLLDLWEQHYAIPTDSSLTTEQRQARLEAKIQSRGPCNPVRLAAFASSVMNGAKVEIDENVGPNTFEVIIREPVDDIKPAIPVIERKKPAHLIYRMRSELDTESELVIAAAMTHAENHTLETVCVFQETADANLMAAFAVTHSENFTVEVF